MKYGVVEMEKVQEDILEKLRLAFEAHSGDGQLEIVEITPDGFVKVRMTGACATCPSGQQSMLEMAEQRIKEVCPELKGAILVHQVNQDLIQQALKILRKEK